MSAAASKTPDYISPHCKMRQDKSTYLEAPAHAIVWRGKHSTDIAAWSIACGGTHTGMFSGEGQGRFHNPPGSRILR